MTRALLENTPLPFSTETPHPMARPSRLFTPGPACVWHFNFPSHLALSTSPPLRRLRRPSPCCAVLRTNPWPAVPSLPRGRLHVVTMAPVSPLSWSPTLHCRAPGCLCLRACPTALAQRTRLASRLERLSRQHLPRP